MHFPIACWVFAFVLDTLLLVGAPVTWLGVDADALCTLLLWAGIATALPAMALGMVDFAALPEKPDLLAAAYRHMALMLGAWSLYLAGALTRYSEAIAWPFLDWGLVAAGFCCLGAGGWYGGRLVYHYHLGQFDDHRPK